MTINKYFFNYRNTNFVIFAKDIPEAFEPYRRILYHKAGTEEEFENNLLKETPDIRNCLVLCGRSVTRPILNDLLKPYQKPHIFETKIMESRKYTDAPKEIADALKQSVPVSEEIALGQVKRKRGRPKGSKNKPKVKPESISNNSLDSYFQ